MLLVLILPRSCPVRSNIFPDGFYYTYMLLGNPPSPCLLDVDKGRDQIWIQRDAPCTSCAKGANSSYKPRRGSILPPKDSLCVEVQRRHTEDQVRCESCLQCDYEMEYADQSSSMQVLAPDELHMMNRGVIKNTMGLCLIRDVDGVGYLFQGDDFVPRWGTSWVPMIDSSSHDYYFTPIATVKYGNALLSLGGKDGRVGLAFDTGSLQRKHDLSWLILLRASGGSSRLSFGFLHKVT